MSHRKSDLGIPCPQKICQSSASTTLADLLTPPVVANPFSTMRVPESFMKLRLSKRAMASSPSNFLLRGDCKPALLGELCVHDHAGRGAVGKLARVAGGDEAALAHRLERREPFEGDDGPVALIALERHQLQAFSLCVLVDHLLDRRQRRDFLNEAATLLRGGGAALALERISVLRLAGDAVARRHDISGLDHRHPQRGFMLLEPVLIDRLAVRLLPPA